MSALVSQILETLFSQTLRFFLSRNRDLSSSLDNADLLAKFPFSLWYSSSDFSLAAELVREIALKYEGYLFSQAIPPRFKEILKGADPRIFQKIPADLFENGIEEFADFSLFSPKDLVNCALYFKDASVLLKEIEKFSLQDQAMVISSLQVREFTKPFKEGLQIFAKSDSSLLQAAVLECLCKNQQISREEWHEYLKSTNEDKLAGMIRLFLENGLSQEVPLRILERGVESQNLFFCEQSLQMLSKRGGESASSLYFKTVSSFFNGVCENRLRIALQSLEGSIHQDPRIFEWVGSLLHMKKDPKILELIFASLPPLYGSKDFYAKLVDRLPSVRHLVIDRFNLFSGFEDFYLYQEWWGKYSSEEKVLGSLSLGLIQICQHHFSYWIDFYHQALESQKSKLLQSLFSQPLTKEIELFLVSLQAAGSQIMQASALLLFHGSLQSAKKVRLFLNENSLDFSSFSDLVFFLEYGFSRYSDQIPEKGMEALSFFQEADVFVKDSDLEFILKFRKALLAQNLSLCQTLSFEREDFFHHLARSYLFLATDQKIEQEDLEKLRQKAGDCFWIYEMQREAFGSNFSLEKIFFQSFLEEKKKILHAIKDDSFGRSVLDSLNLSFPLDHTLHALFSTWFLGCYQYEEALRHLCFGFFSIFDPLWEYHLCVAFLGVNQMGRVQKVVDFGEFEKKEIIISVLRG